MPKLAYWWSQIQMLKLKSQQVLWFGLLKHWVFLCILIFSVICLITPNNVISHDMYICWDWWPTVSGSVLSCLLRDVCLLCIWWSYTFGKWQFPCIMLRWGESCHGLRLLSATSAGIAASRISNRWKHIKSLSNAEKQEGIESFFWDDVGSQFQYPIQFYLLL